MEKTAKEEGVKVLPSGLALQDRPFGPGRPA